MEEAELLAQIKIFHEKSGKISGSPNIFRDLVAAGVPCSLNRVARITRKYGIASRIRKRHVVTTDSKHTMPVAPNLLEQNFHVDKINKIWTGDITYIPTKEGWLSRKAFSIQGRPCQRRPIFCRLWGSRSLLRVLPHPSSHMPDLLRAGLPLVLSGVPYTASPACPCCLTTSFPT